MDFSDSGDFYDLAWIFAILLIFVIWRGFCDSGGFCDLAWIFVRILVILLIWREFVCF